MVEYKPSYFNIRELFNRKLYSDFEVEPENLTLQLYAKKYSPIEGKLYQPE